MVDFEEALRRHLKALEELLEPLRALDLDSPLAWQVMVNLHALKTYAPNDAFRAECKSLAEELGSAKRATSKAVESARWLVSQESQLRDVARRQIHHGEQLYKRQQASMGAPPPEA